jgi:hypothetical protein
MNTQSKPRRINREEFGVAKQSPRQMPLERNSERMDLSRTKQLFIIILGILLFFIGIALAAFGNIPGLFAYYTSTKYIALLVSVILALTIIFIAAPSLKIKRSFVDSFTGKVTLVAIILFAASIILSISPLNSLLGIYTQWEFNLVVYLAYIISFFGFSIMFHVLRESDQHFAIFDLLISLLILGTVIYGLGEYYGWNPQTGYISNYVSRISLGFRNPLYAGFFIGILWNYCFTRILSFWLWKEKSLQRNTLVNLIWQYILFASLTYVFTLTFTRSAWIASAAIALVTTIGIIWIARRQQSATLIRTFLLGIVILATVGVNTYILKGPLTQRNEDLFADSNDTIQAISRSVGSVENAKGFFQNADKYSSAEIRIMEWAWGISTIFANPKVALIGTGPDAAGYLLPKYRFAEFNNIPTDNFTRPSYIRNTYINILLMHGFLFSIILLWGGFKAAVWTIKQIKNASIREKQYILAAAALILSFLAQAFFYTTMFPIILLVVFAAAFILSGKSEIFTLEYKNKLSLLPKVLLGFTGILIATWIGIVTFSEWKLDYLSTLWAPNQGDLKDTQYIPVNSNIYKRIYSFYFPHNPPTQQYLPSLENSNDIDDLRTASGVLYAQGRVQMDNSKVERSMVILQKLIENDPTAPTHRDELGLRYLYLQDFAKAENEFDAAIQLKKDYWYAYLHKGELLRQMCKPKEAITWYEQAKNYVPQANDEIIEAQNEIDVPREECKVN